jgi:FSR family fosmidomycin resistance protein-like MFS transporter
VVASERVGYRGGPFPDRFGAITLVQTVAARGEGSVARVSALRVGLVVAFAHGLTDAYASFIPPLLPRIMDELDISIAMAATLTVAFGISGSLPQPLLGYLADRFGRRAFATAGPLLAGVSVASIGFTSTFWTLLVVLMFAGLGNAAFHPPGASYAARVGEGKGAGRRYSLFAFGGAAGFAIGPLAAVWIVQWRGLDGLWVAMIPALMFAPLIYVGLPSDRDESHAAKLPPPPGAVLAQLRGPLGLMFGISATMSFVQRSFLTMEPIIVAEGGGSETLGAVALSVYLGAQSFGMVMGGLLADRMSRRTLLTRLCFWALPAHLVAVWLGPTSALGLLAIATAGFLGLATLPPIVVMAQESLPSAAGVSSGIVMGLAWATGSVGVLGTGALADAIGPYAATLLAMPVMLLALGFALHPALEPVSHPPSHTP